MNSIKKSKQRSTDPVSTNDLQHQYEKTKAMLNNPNLKLPDGGAKLKAKLAELEVLMKQSLTDKVSELSLNDHKVNIRQQTLERSKQTPMSTNLLRAHSAKDARVAQMMSLEESMKLQESQQKDIKLANMRKRMEEVTRSSKTQESLADDLEMAMNQLQLDPEIRQPSPDDDGSSEDEYDSDDSLEGAYEDEGFEEDTEEDERHS
ncbi:hypothetical protein EDC96DRAFT_297555 [Choanephora cucurbitarum]|nr:hypothetical protein EDC96DRAFT_297555 [Choanephora cucurbitarum]